MTTFLTPDTDTPPRRLTRRHFLQITAAATGTVLLGRYAAFPKPFTTLNETRTLMGTVINLAVTGPDSHATQEAIQATFAEMERLIALFDQRRPQSPLALLNRTGHLADPPAELVELVQRAQRYSDLSGGAFDISVQPLVDAYESGQDAAAVKPLVNYQNIQIGIDALTLSQPGMTLTLDGIAKGRVVDGATTVLQSFGFHNILVEAGGDLIGLGTRSDGTPWRVGIDNPRATGSNVLRVLPISRHAVATSGDYRHSFSQDFRHHHIIDPRTGLSPTDLASVTVIAPSATDADALSTTAMVLGVEAGLALLNRLPHVEGLLITKTMEIRQTAGFPM